MWQALIIGVVANMLPVPIIFFFARRVLEWGANKPVIGGFFTWCLKKGHKGGKKLADTAGDKGIFIALLLFVGIPIPGTGAWTGSLIASVLEMDRKKTFLVVLAGVFMASIIMMLISFGLVAKVVG